MKIILVTIAAIVLHISKGNGVPVNETEDNNKGKADQLNNIKNEEEENCLEDICNPLGRKKIHRRDLDDFGDLFSRFARLLQETIFSWRDRLMRPINTESVYPHPISHQPVYARPTVAPRQYKSKPEVKAYCNLMPNRAVPPEKRMDVRGQIFLTEKASNYLEVNVQLTGLLPNKTAPVTSQSFKHGFHVHEFGNLTNGCESTGPHFNPLNKTHGAPNSTKRHFGDLGNLETDTYGNLEKKFQFYIPQALTGPHSFIGRALVVHEKVDDLGTNPSIKESLTTGNSGSRLGCCIVYKLG